MKGKTYVWVRARTDANGVITPEAFKIEEQLVRVDGVMACRPAHATKAGGRGTRYTVRVGAQEIYLFLDEDRRWFLEEEQNVREIPYHD